MERRLAAVLAADVVGFAHLVEADEAGTEATLAAHRSELIEPMVLHHGGRIMKQTGAGVVIAFANVVDAVSTAVTVQRGMVRRNAGVPKSARMDLRIGIDLADISASDDTLGGDIIKVAKRLEALAEPGSICISGTVHAQIAGKLNHRFVEGGERSDAAMPEPVQLWHWSDEIATPTDKALPLALPDKPSIAVLPFADRSGDHQQAFLADGIAEDLITGLSRRRGLFVIARSSSFAYQGKSPKIWDVGRELGVAYVVEGSIKRDGDAIAVSAQMIDTRTGNQVWNTRRDGALGDIIAIESELVEAIATTLSVPSDSPPKALANRPNVDAFELVLQARWLWYRDQETVAPIIELLEKALALEPAYAEAFALLADVYATNIFSANVSLDRHAELARHYALKALEADAKDTFVQAVAALTFSVLGDFDLAETHSSAAVVLNPNDYLAVYSRGTTLTYAGHMNAGLMWLEKAMRLDPHAAHQDLEVVVECHYMRHAYLDAIKTFKRWQSAPLYMYDVLAVCYAQLGRLEDAADALDIWLSNQPDGYNFNDTLGTHMNMCKRQEDRDHWLEGYRKAGLVT
ncbi:MAG: adenylate/guanylate cyclase domain-containing protein [Pseudomonadota bacterium]